MDTTTSLMTAMKRTINALRTWWRDESAVTAIEYGLLAALIVVACVVAFGNFGDALKGVFDTWSAAVLAAI